MTDQKLIRILDLFCGGGGAAVGYHRAFKAAGYDVQITGIDRWMQPDYPYTFKQTDAPDYLCRCGHKYDFIHASPPCQDHTWSARRWLNSGHRQPNDMLPQTEILLKFTGKPYVIENVEGAPLLNAITLCGTQFGLRVFRHRKFVSNLHLWGPGGPCMHKGFRVGFGPDDFVTVAGHGGDGSGSLANWQDAMGIDWITDKDQLKEAIPPAYTQFIGQQLVKYFEDIQEAA